MTKPVPPEAEQTRCSEDWGQGTVDLHLWPIEAPLVGFSRKLAESMAHVSLHLAPVLTKLADAMNRLQEPLREAGLAVERLPAIMVELGWPPVMKLDLPSAVQIVRRYDAEGTEAVRQDVSDAILSLYDDDQVRRLLPSWEKQRFLRRRMPILRQVIEAHIAGHYWVSVPALLPQIEGIIPERYGRKKGRRCTFRNLTQELEVLLATRGITFLEGWMGSFYTKVVLAEFVYGSDPDSSLSRHAILHGHDTSYGTAENSLKAILTFDYLQREMYRLVGSPKGGCYHVVGCPVVDTDRPDLECYDSHALAKASGRKPCKACMPPNE